jgi:hypothetical protein
MHSSISARYPPSPRPIFALPQMRTNLRTPNGLGHLIRIIPILGLHLLDQLHVSLLRLLLRDALIHDLLPRALLRFALVGNQSSARLFIPLYEFRDPEGNQEREGRKIRARDPTHTFRSNVPGFSALLISSPVATLYSPIRHDSQQPAHGTVTLVLQCTRGKGRKEKHRMKIK